MKRPNGLAWLFGLAAMWLVGCNRPCATTADCGDGDVCAAAICRALACEEAIFARDPQSGVCMALSGCFLTAEQRSWQLCQDDPCAGRDENSCIGDTRCQASYATPDYSGPGSFAGAGGGFSSCRGQSVETPRPLASDPPGTMTAPGRNNGELPKHGSFDASCLPGKSRQFAGCRAVPQLAPQQPCAELTTEQCTSRRDCSTTRTPNTPFAVSDTALCFDRFPRQASCIAADAMSCLTNPSCQAVGASCYCPPGGTCDCSGGGFLSCEKNDRLRRCSSSAECNADERCDNDEACIAPRTFASVPVVPTVPGRPGCLGACVPTGCVGMGEQQCNASATCDAGSYATFCTPRTYYGGPLDALPEDLATGCTESTCSCESRFVSCAVTTPSLNLRAERSLLVRDPEIIDDQAFSLLSVLTRLAPAGQVDGFVQSLLSQLGAAQKVNNGAVANLRQGFTRFYENLGHGALAQPFSKMMATTALINRLDLASANNCGQARLSFALTNAYHNGNQRLTLIVELVVPDDGNGCKTVAQRWAELSLVDDPAQRRRQLIALYGELLTPAHLGQIRTNEFVNINGNEPWELREFHLRAADGLLELAPVAQTVPPTKTLAPALLGWLRANTAALKAGTAIIPAGFLAAASTEDGGRLTLSGSTDPSNDAEIRGFGKSLNELSCSGCHLTETRSPFVHIGERLAKKVGDEYIPLGRAVIDDFLQKELVKRTKLLSGVLTGTQGLVASDWRPLVQARVH